MRVLLLSAALLGGCTQDQTVTSFKRVLTTRDLTFDAGMVAVDTREPLPIFLQSTGRGGATIYDIQVDDPEHWVIFEDWKTDDCFEKDGINDCQIVDGGTESDPAYSQEVTIAFAPKAEEEYRTVLTVISNDTEVAERVEGGEFDGMGVWRIVLRGIGRYPCATVYPSFHDFGPRAAGGYFDTTATIENCGVVTLTVSAFDIVGDPAFLVDSPTPIYALPGGRQEIDIGYSPGSSSAESATIEFVLNDPYFEGTIDLIGNDCENSNNYDWDDDGDGYWECGSDCDDTDGAINPDSTEKDNGRDDDCDGRTDESSDGQHVDNDKDGYSEDDGDCDDQDAEVYPGATEVVNQIDDDCDNRVDEGTDWSDDDGDGFSEREGDCDDSAVLVYPGAEEKQNEYDDDCDGNIDEGSFYFDDDADGFTELDDQADCNDADPWTFPGATEDCDGRDNDCDGMTDEGEDNTPDGACAFVVERVVENTAQQGCNAGLVAPSLAGLVIAAVAAVRRRED